MININADLHTHTNASHGKGTMAENVRAAVERGLQKIAITDHGPAHLFGVGIADPKILLAQKEEASALAERWPQIQILVGVEANIISPEGELDVPAEILSQLDLVLAGLHPRIRPASWGATRDLVLNNWLASSPRFRPRAVAINTQAVIAALNRYKIDFITHPGLKLAINTEELAQAAAKQNVALELSSGHGASSEFLAEVMKSDVKLVITSDAHRPERVGDFRKALALAQEYKIPASRILNADK